MCCLDEDLLKGLWVLQYSCKVFDKAPNGANASRFRLSCGACEMKYRVPYGFCAAFLLTKILSCVSLRMYT